MVEKPQEERVFIEGTDFEGRAETSSPCLMEAPKSILTASPTSFLSLTK